MLSWMEREYPLVPKGSGYEGYRGGGVCLFLHVFNLHADVLESFGHDDLSDVRLVDFLVVESVLALEDVPERLAGVVEVRLGVGESELVVHAVGRVG